MEVTKPVYKDQTIGLDEYMHGKVWAAHVRRLDPDAPGGLDRRFLPTESKDLSRSGRTGTRYVYVHDVPEGAVVETQEPRPKYGRRYWVRRRDRLVQVSREEACRLLRQAQEQAQAPEPEPEPAGR